MGAVVEVAEQVGEVVVSDVLQEAIDEITGRSGRKWALVLLAAIVGGVIAALIAKKLRESKLQESSAE